MNRNSMRDTNVIGGRRKPLKKI